MKQFRTSDGYTLELRHGVWTDGDMLFDTCPETDMPVDSAGGLIEGELTERPNSQWFVSVYDCAQAFGGREEGGWWYDTGSLVRTVWMTRNEEAAYDYSRRLNQRLQSRDFGPNQGKRQYTSVLSDGEFRAMVSENSVPAGFPDRKPHYE